MKILETNNFVHQQAKFLFIISLIQVIGFAESKRKHHHGRYVLQNIHNKQGKLKIYHSSTFAHLFQLFTLILFSCSHSSQGSLGDWEWWEVLLLTGGIVLAAILIWVPGQLLCSTECQEKCIQKHCCGGNSQDEEV